jgi:hypothetical protein
VADDPRKLKPGQLCRILNSTPLGNVLTDRKLRAHRTRAGLRIGDGKTIDLVRYAAWLVDQRPRPSPAERVSPETRSPTLSFGDAYEAKKERERERNAGNSRSGRDVLQVLGCDSMPGPADPERRRRAVDDFAFFLEAYFPERFPLAFSPDHLRLVAEMQVVVGEVGGLKAFAMPRGSGKTTICECLVIWACVTGRRKFVALIGASKEHADEMMESVKGEFETNELLAADFPEVCLPIQALEGINNRCKGQLFAGERTHIQWAGSTIVLPTVAGSQASGAIIRARGILGRVRGMKFKRPDGEIARPDLAIVDDPQTDESAKSENQCKKRLAVVTGAILGLAGPNKSIAAFMPCTIIQRGDMADEVLNRERDGSAEWQGEITKLVYEWPTAAKLWEEYAELLIADLRAGDRQHKRATAFYKKHRKEMDAGSRVAWPARFKKHELSALQHAYNLKITRPLIFDAEYQNSPRVADDEDNRALKPSEIEIRTSGLKRRVCPLATSHVSAFIDVQHKLLYFVVIAWSDNFTGTVIDYGTFPDQLRAYFTLREARNTLQKLYPKGGLKATIQAGLMALIEQLVTTQWAHESGTPLKLGKLLIDAKDGQLTETIATVCRTSPHAGIVQPSQGKGIGPADRPMYKYAVKPGDRLGDHWLSARNQKHAVRFVTIDTNYWKSFIRDRFALALGSDGALTLFGEKGTDHRMLAAHATAETCNKLRNEKDGRSVDVWKVKPGRPDNHILDGLVGCAVGASMLGCSELVRVQRPEPPQAPRQNVRYDVF